MTSKQKTLVKIARSVGKTNLVRLSVLAALKDLHAPKGNSNASL